MKILQVCPYDFSRPGGVKTHILGLSDALRKKGHEVKIIVPTQSTIATTDFDVFPFGRNVDLAFGGTKIDINICFGGEWRKLKNFIKEEKFDVVHYHTIWNPFLALQIRMIFRGRQVATFHDTPSNTRMGRFLGRWVIPLMGSVIFYWLDCLISVSETQKKCIARFSKREIRVIPNGIAPVGISERGRKSVDEEFTILFLGRLEPRKGIMDAIKAFEMFNKAVPNSCLIVAGEGRDNEKAQHYCSENELTQVEFLGPVNEQKKQGLLATADIYLGSALYGESFGIVLLEAMQAGVPMVGYANDGYKELLTTEQLEYFVKPGDISKLTKALLRIRELTSLDKLKKIGISHASGFEWGKHVEKIELLYNS